MWFDAGIGNMVGAIAGSLVGITGGTWGAIAGINAPKGKHRGIVINFARVLLVLGAISLLIGIIALLSSQPKHVWYPFCVIGLIVLVCLIPNYLAVKKTYAKAELKKIAADDLK